MTKILFKIKFLSNDMNERTGYVVADSWASAVDISEKYCGMRNLILLSVKIDLSYDASVGMYYNTLVLDS